MADVYLRRALELKPDDIDARDNLAQLVRQSGRLLAAAKIYDEAKDATNTSARVTGNMALLYTDLGRFDEAERLFRRALELKPNYPYVIRTCSSASTITPKGLPKRSSPSTRRSMPRTRSPLRRRKSTSPNDRTPDASCALDISRPTSATMQPASSSIPCFATSITRVSSSIAMPKSQTRMRSRPNFKSLATEWRSTCGLSDEALANLIRADKIDVLVDFGGHTSASRLLVMAHRAAPIQIEHSWATATPLVSPRSTPLSAMPKWPRPAASTCSPSASCACHASRSPMPHPPNAGRRASPVSVAQDARHVRLLRPP